MIALGNILVGIGSVLDMLLFTVMILVIARAVISWVNADPFNPLVRFIHSSTEPFLVHVRRYLPLVSGNIDFSPIILMVLIYFLQIAIAQSIIDYGQQIKMQAIHSQVVS